MATQFIQNFQRSNIFFTIAGISGALSVALGAYGNHGKSCACLYYCNLYWAVVLGLLAVHMILNFKSA